MRELTHGLVLLRHCVNSLNLNKDDQNYEPNVKDDAFLVDASKKLQMSTLIQYLMIQGHQNISAFEHFPKEKISNKKGYIIQYGHNCGFMAIAEPCTRLLFQHCIDCLLSKLL